MTTAKRRRAAVMLVAVALALPACGDDDVLGGLIGDDEGIPGSGDVVAESRAVTDFDRVLLRGEGDMVVVIGGDESLTVETDDNLLQYIESTVAGGRLEISTEPGIDIAPTRSVSYRVGVTSLSSVELSGAGSIDIGAWDAGAASVVLSGVGEIDVADLTATDLVVELGGVGSIILAGSVDSQTVLARGVGEYEGADLRSRTASVEARDTGVATLWVTDEFDVTAADLGKVFYYGPAAVTRQVEGIGAVAHLGDK